MIFEGGRRTVAPFQEGKGKTVSMGPGGCQTGASKWEKSGYQRANKLPLNGARRAPSTINVKIKKSTIARKEKEPPLFQ